MKKYSSIIAIMLITILGSVGYTKEKKAEEKDDKTESAVLSGKYELQLGELVATFMNGVVDDLQELFDWKAPVVISYSKKEDKIIIALFGSRTTIDSAKGSTDDFRKKVLKEMLVLVDKAFGAKLDDKSYNIIYINKSNRKKMVVYTDGKYMIP